MFSETSDKSNHRASLLEKRQKMVLPSGANALTTNFTKNSEDLGIRRKSSDDLKKKEYSVNDAENTLDRKKLTNNCLSETSLESTLNKNACEKNECPGEKVSDPSEHNRQNSGNTCEKEITKSNQQAIPNCDVQQDANSEMPVKICPLTTSSCHQKATEHRNDISTNATSNVGSTNILLSEDDYQSKKPKISLVSELYSDTDSDSSK